MRDPEAVLAASDLDEEDKVAVLSGDPATLRARLQDPGIVACLFIIFLPRESQPGFDPRAVVAARTIGQSAPIQAFAEAFGQAFAPSFTQAFASALERVFPLNSPDPNADTGDAGSPADHPRNGT
jgi:hypothetical protein